MPQQVKIPEIGESIHEVEIGEWLKQEGDTVEADEPIVVLESEKSSLDLPSPAAGKLVKILKKQGESAEVGEAIAEIAEGDGSQESEEEESDAAAEKDEEDADAEKRKSGKKRGKKSKKQDKRTREEEGEKDASGVEEEEDGKEEEEKQRQQKKKKKKKTRKKDDSGEARDPRRSGDDDTERDEDDSGGDGDEPEQEGEKDAKKKEKKEEKKKDGKRDKVQEADAGEDEDDEDRGVETVAMTPIRRAIATRLLEGTRDAVLLTTFNEIDMFEVTRLREEQGTAFHERHGVKLGLLPFFVKAVVEALEAFPEINAQIRDEEIVYHDYCDIGIAVARGEGLVVPVIRDAQEKSFVQIENEIESFARRAESADLKPSELRGGTFTITNGGVFGSLMSTPVINPPQSAILGLHAIHDRPVARDGEVVIRPMMYVALTYDHRLIDGREAVQFLTRVRDLVERPARMLLDL